jgi:hypothetical protein
MAMMLKVMMLMVIRKNQEEDIDIELEENIDFINLKTI